jgi:hypothetical protein
MTLPGGFRGLSGVKVRLMSDGELTRPEVLRNLHQRRCTRSDRLILRFTSRQTGDADAGMWRDRKQRQSTGRIVAIGPIPAWRRANRNATRSLTEISAAALIPFAKPPAADRRRLRRRHRLTTGERSRIADSRPDAGGRYFIRSWIFAMAARAHSSSKLPPGAPLTPIPPIAFPPTMMVTPPTA